MSFMKVYIVYRLTGHLGIPDVVGVFSTLEKAEDAVKRFAKQFYNPGDNWNYVDVDEYAEDNFTIEKWFVDAATLRGE